MVTKLWGNDGPLWPFPQQHGWLLLHAHVAILAVNLAQFIRGAIKHWLGHCKCLVYSQMAESAMSHMYHIEDGKHVDYSAPSVFVNQILLGGSIQRFALLNWEVLYIFVPLRVLPTEPVDSWAFLVIIRAAARYSASPQWVRHPTMSLYWPTVLMNLYFLTRSRRRAWSMIAMPLGLMLKAHCKNIVQCFSIMIAWAVLMAAASLAAAVAIAAAWDSRAWRKAAAPTAPLMGLGMAGGTTRTADATEDDVKD